MQYAPLPTEDQLARVCEVIGADSLVHKRRIESGLSCTMDVLSEGGNRLVLRRYGPWYEERGEDAAARETRALELLQRSNIPAPAPIWIDTEGVFQEQAIVTSFIEGDPDLTPSNPFDWADQLANSLARIHDIRLDEEDREFFPPGAGEDERRILEDLEQVLEHPLGEDLLRHRLMLDDRRVEAGHVFSHTDYWPGNTLWTAGELVAVVDWEAPATNERAMDVAYCSIDIRYQGMDKVADRFVAAYEEATGETLPNLDYWEAVALCRPLPDISRWVPAWQKLGLNVTEDQVRGTHSKLIERALELSLRP
jgi:aminoglycoside phosphotransferase (APT) family kinase protein